MTENSRHQARIVCQAIPKIVWERENPLSDRDSGKFHERAKLALDELRYIPVLLALAGQKQMSGHNSVKRALFRIPRPIDVFA